MLLADSEAEQRVWARAHLKLARRAVKVGVAGGGALGGALEGYVGLAAARLAELQASADGRGDALDFFSCSLARQTRLKYELAKAFAEARQHRKRWRGLASTDGRRYPA